MHGGPGKSFGVGDDDVQDSVLVNPVEFVEPPEGIIRKHGPSMVRLQPLDLCLSGGAHAPDLGLARASESGGAGSQATLVPISDNREFGVLLDLIGKRSSVRRREFECEMVQCCAEALEAVPDKQRNIGGREWRRGDPGSMCARMLRVGLLHDGIVCGLVPVEDCALTPLQVVLRP